MNLTVSADHMKKLADQWGVEGFVGVVQRMACTHPILKRGDMYICAVPVSLTGGDVRGWDSLNSETARDLYYVSAMLQADAAGKKLEPRQISDVETPTGAKSDTR